MSCSEMQFYGAVFTPIMNASGNAIEAGDQLP